MEDKIAELLSQMTIEEKVMLLAGSAMWYTTPVPRLGIPAIKVTDGPNGARGGERFAGGLTSACFPVSIALAATWNTDLVERVGQALGEEARSKGAHILLAPTVNIHRSPLNGRNFECFSEDPYLSARIAVAYIKGVQSQNVGTAVKHYVCNDSEFQRTTISSEVRERALREIYLPPFKAAVQEAHTWSVMASYNKVNGTYASENPYLLTDILSNEWGFEGLVMSDWFGTKSTAAAVKAGLDLEMPGPPVWRGEKLLQAFRAGEVDEATIDRSVRRLLRIIAKSGAFENPEDRPEQAVDKPEHRALTRQAAAEGMVLLKNDGNILPLDTEKIKSLAIIGPNARIARIMGGGSSHVNPHYAVTPFDGIVSKVGEAVKIGFEIGCTNHKLLPLINPAWLTPSGGPAGKGFTLEFFNSPDCSGKPVKTTVVETSEQTWFGEIAPEVNAAQFSARLTGRFTAPETGRYTFGLSSAGPSRLFIDDQEVIDRWTSSADSGPAELTSALDMVAGQSCELKVEYSKPSTVPLASIRLGCLPPIPENAMDRAIALAAASDVALVFVGLSDEWESEGFDRPDMELVGDQVALIEKVAAANKNTIVVLNTGSPITMNWLDKVAAVVQAWYPGQECGNAIADVLFGDVNPSGRLPQTFPKRLEDNPAYINYPGENGKVYYGEGIFVGYRYYDRKKIEPLFPFGYGLSYTTFAYSHLRLSASEIDADEELQVSVEVQNTGARAGQEVVQLYVRDVEASLIRPEKELKGFAKVFLAPGETKTVTLTLNRESLAYYDDLARQWVAEAGEFEVLVGSSSRDIHASARFTLKTTSRFGGPEKAGVRLGLDSTLQLLLASEEARAILNKHLPGLLDAPQLSMALGFTLEQVAGFAPNVFTPEVMQAIAEDLAQLSPVAISELPAPPKLNLWQRLLAKLASWRARR
ncbi:MAG: glycoside hydrolase family 3 C-terminal domain-containing protein [Anaerolineae bacterium]|jgi:beta-glucosidase|nr:glycoside hydrolase family 3 C-terminal domain-containing protein [Anaerolineae bacterium]MDH7472421.1 glycoside hydrolase family 3 C-terminal domain-containing protein [Anaerolineae bacterium]